MNEAFKELLTISDKIKHNGWISIVPSYNGRFNIHAEWIVEYRGRFTFHYPIDFDDINFSHISLADEFIEKANNEIDRIMSGEK